MQNRLKTVREKVDQAISSYPMPLACAAIAGIAAFVGIRLTEGPDSDAFEVVKLAFTGCLGISLMFGIKMFSQRIGKLQLLEIIGVMLLAAFYFILPNHEKDFTEVYAFVLVSVFILTHLFVSFAPYINRVSEFKFWQYNKNLFINIVLTAIFTGVLVGGVLLAILAVDKLFDLELRSTVYPQMFFFLSILGSAFIFLLFSGRGLQTLESDDSYPEILKFFTQFVLIPLLLIYAAILYFYSVKILIRWELPRGWVSYLILAYSVVGILALLLIHPLKGSSSKSWVKGFSNVFYFTLLPLLILLFTAIFTRILEYGYTEARYFVLLLALWLAVVFFYFIFFRKASIKFIPTSLFAFGVFGLIFPYFNAFSTAKRSQKSELKEVLIKNNLLKDGGISFTKKINDSVAEEIADKFQFLADRNEKEFLFIFIPNQTDLQNSIAKKERSNVRNLTKSAFKNIAFNESELHYGEDLLLVSALKVFPVAGYDYSVSLFPNQNVELPLNKDKLSLQQTKNATFVVLASPDKYSQSYDLIPFLNKIADQYKNQNGRFEIPEISTEFNLGKYHIKVYIKVVNYYKNQNTISAVPQEITLLIQKK